MSDQASAERTLLARVARMHYVEGLPKVDIADELQISRFRVARLLTRAVEEGIVTITINDDGIEDEFLSAQLRDYLGVDHCTVVRCYGDEEKVRTQVGAAAAAYLSRTLKDGEVLGLTWGRTLSAVTEQLRSLPKLEVVQLTGSVSGELRSSPVELVRRASRQAGGAVNPIFSPLFISDVSSAEILRQHPDIKQAIRLFDSVTTAVMSVGSWDPDNSQIPDVLPKDIVQDARAQGCAADIAGILLNRGGRIVSPEVQDHYIGIRFDQLRRVPRVIAVATSPDKAVAIKAVVRAGLVDELFVDHALAETLVQGKEEQE